MFVFRAQPGVAEEALRKKHFARFMLRLELNGIHGHYLMTKRRKTGVECTRVELFKMLRSNLSQNYVFLRVNFIFMLRKRNFFVKTFSMFSDQTFVC